MSKAENQFFYKNNRLQQLRGFCAVMQFGNLSKAAKQLGLTHAAISLQIKSLEDDLGVKLFERTGPKIKATKDAQTLYEVSNHYVEGMNSVFNQFHERREESGFDELKIAANNSAINFILPRLLKYYMPKNPNIYPIIRYCEFKEGLERLKHGDVDVLLMPRRDHLPLDPMLYEYTPFFHYAPVLMTLPDHPLAGKKNVTMEEICKYDVTLPAKGQNVISLLTETFERYGNKRLRITFEEWSVARKYVEAGLAISIAIDASFDGGPDRLVRTSLLHLLPPADFGLIIKKDHVPDRKLQTLYDVAKKYGPKISSDLLK